jgi:hypothetical protein
MRQLKGLDRRVCLASHLPQRKRTTGSVRFSLDTFLFGRRRNAHKIRGLGRPHQYEGFPKDLAECIVKSVFSTKLLPVTCRVAGLEFHVVDRAIPDQVTCCVGGLELRLTRVAVSYRVTCRVGGLEYDCFERRGFTGVTCRIGGLEDEHACASQGASALHNAALAA